MNFQIKNIFGVSAILSFLSIPSAWAVNYGVENADDIITAGTPLPLSAREVILASFLGIILLVGLTAFIGHRFTKTGPYTARTLLAFLMTVILLCSFGLIFVISTVYGQSPIFGIFALIFLLILFKLMNQFEINR